MTASAHRGIHAIGFHHRRADQRGIPVHVIHGREECEVIVVLNNSESEAAPFQGIGYAHHMGVYFFDGHVALIDRYELDIVRTFDRIA